MGAFKTLTIGAAGLVASIAPAQAATTLLTFDGATDPNPRPACSLNNTSGPTATICTTETTKLGSDYGSSAELAVRYARTVNASGGGTAVSPELLFIYANGNGAATPQGDVNNTSRIFFTPAAGYEVSFNSFDFVARNGGGLSGMFSLVDAAGNTVFDFTSVIATTRTTYTANTAFFSGPLTLIADGIGNGQPALDNVLLTTRLIAVPGVVPEPATWAMMVIGFAAAGAMMRRRRQPASEPLAA